MRSEWHWFVRCDLQIFSGCVCPLEQLHAQSPFLFPIVFSINIRCNKDKEHQLGERHGRGDVPGYAHDRPSANRNSELEGPGTRSKLRLAIRESRPKLPWRSLFPKSSFSFFFFFFGSTGLWLAPRAVRSHAAVCVLRLHVLKLLNVRLASSFLAFPWSLGHLSFPPCERSSQWTEQTDRLNYVPVRSQDRVLYRA